MARREALQTSFNAGMVDPRLSEREDIEAYFNGAKEIVNLRPSPQGGLRLRGGLAYCGPHRGEVSAIDIDTAVLTMAGGGNNGGTAPAPVEPPDDPFPYPDFEDYWNVGNA